MTWTLGHVFIGGKHMKPSERHKSIRLGQAMNLAQNEMLKYDKEIAEGQFQLDTGDMISVDAKKTLEMVQEKYKYYVRYYYYLLNDMENELVHGDGKGTKTQEQIEKETGGLRL